MNRFLNYRVTKRFPPCVKWFHASIPQPQQKAVNPEQVDQREDPIKWVEPASPKSSIDVQQIQPSFTLTKPNVSSILPEPFAKLKNSQIMEIDAISKELQQRRAAAFDEIPGPEFLKTLAKLWSYVPLFGNHLTAGTMQKVLSAGKVFGSQLSWGNNMTFFRYLLNEYGPIVRLRGPFGGDVIILSRPEHAAQVFESDGPYPVRSSLDCIEKYRKQHRRVLNAGPFSMNGPEWETLRQNIEPALKQSLVQQCKRISKTADDFVERIIAIRNEQLEVPSSFDAELEKWSLECLCSVAFNKSLGFLNPRGLVSNSENAILLDAINNATKAIKRCEFGFHLWKIFETPAWKSLTTHCDAIENVLLSHLRRAEQELKERQKSTNLFMVKGAEVSLVEYFLLQDQMTHDDILSILFDMTILGINMSAQSAGFLLYYLSKNPRAQFQLYNEVKRLPEEITLKELKELKYLKACLYESLRLKPPMPVLNRILNKDVTIYGYQIPKGTFVLIATNLSSLREEQFEDAVKFQPERWLGLDGSQDVGRLATMPFGYGPRDCLAKDLAELQLYYLIFKIIRTFRVEYHYGDIESNNKLLSSPNRPFKLRFVERNTS